MGMRCELIKLTVPSFRPMSVRHLELFYYALVVERPTDSAKWTTKCAPGTGRFEAIDRFRPGPTAGVLYSRSGFRRWTEIRSAGKGRFFRGRIACGGQSGW